MGNAREEVWARVVDELDLGLLVLDHDSRVLAANAVARSLVSGLLKGELQGLLSAVGAPEDGATTFSPAVPWTNADGHRVFARAKRLAPYGLLVALNRERVRERDLVELLRTRYGLTVRQQQIVVLLRSGLSNRRIAQTLGVTEATVKAYLTGVFQAFGVPNRTALLVALESQRPVS
ncbi:MAG: response regulator transcription factor [Deltaproteobacteria bacterium]|nr:response regulator transcription factor [Deltaproteobacteria bacterium]